MVTLNLALRGFVVTAFQRHDKPIYFEKRHMKYKKCETRGKQRWGRWWLDATSPLSVNIEYLPGHVMGVLFNDLKQKEHRERWIRLVIAETPGVTPTDIRALERAVRNLVEAGLLDDGSDPVGAAVETFVNKRGVLLR